MCGGTAVAPQTLITVRVFRRWPAALLLLLLLPCDIPATSVDPFAWLYLPTLLDGAARVRLERGEVVVRVLPSPDGEIGLVVAARLNAEPETLARWASSIAQFKKGPYVLAVGRFSDPPVVDDLQTMMLEQDDMESLRECHPDDCEVKLPADAIVALRQVAETGGTRWRDVVQEHFRQIVLNRVLAYRSDGFRGLQPYADRRKPIDAMAAFAGLAARSPYLQSTAFTTADTESFFYWSKEQYGTGKPVIGVTHVDIVRPRLPGALRLATVSREILATHYRNASLGMTAVTEDAVGHRYLIYVNRSQLDMLGGIFGGWKRSILEGRLKNETAGMFTEVRRRLESGPPPD